MTEFNSTVSGIPCIIKVTEYTNVPARISGLWENSSPAEFEFEYEVFDRKGYRALWLEEKLMPADDDRLAEEFITYLQDD